MGNKMASHGVHHLGLASADYEGTVDFYTNKVGWTVVWQDQHHDENGNELMRHVFFDMGDGTLVAFICSRPNSPWFPEKWGTDINSGLGMLLPATYHFAFNANSEAELLEKQKSLESAGVETSVIFNHDWIKSFYFKDPINGLILEYCYQFRDFNDDDKVLKHREQPGFDTRNKAELERTSRIMNLPLAFMREHGMLDD